MLGVKGLAKPVGLTALKSRNLSVDPLALWNVGPFGFVPPLLLYTMNTSFLPSKVVVPFLQCGNVTDETA